MSYFCTNILNIEFLFVDLKDFFDRRLIRTGDHPTLRPLGGSPKSL